MLNKSLRLIFYTINAKIGIMDFTKSNDKERAYYNQDFSSVNELLRRIRKALISHEKLNINDLKLSEIFKFIPNETIIYITLFQTGNRYNRYGSKRSTFEATLNRDIEMLLMSKRIKDFDIANENSCRIMIECGYDRVPIKRKFLNTERFDNGRFEPGVSGLELRKDGISYYYMPTDAILLSHMGLNKAVETLAKRSPIGKLTNKISERVKILLSSKDYEYYLFKSRAFITFKDKVLPLYRGNIRFTEFDREVMYNQVVNSSEWLIDNMHDDGRFLYYYNCTDDNFVDHEHPSRHSDNLYYNDLRHCGGIITLLRAFQLTKDDKFIQSAKKAINWNISITKEHETRWGTGYYAFYNQKAKLGGTGVLLTALMQYRNISGDKSYDEYIKGYVRHLLSRIYDNGEFLGYYIHPLYQDGNPLISMSDAERKETFSFYYPGEALLGLGLFANNFKEDNDLVNEVRRMSEIALDWIIDERPKIYADLFTALPSDAWLMQAVEEWAKDEHFRKENYLNFVFGDANTMIKKTYTANNSPYIDFEGGYYYNYGDHFYPDGARSEGLIAAYYLAKELGRDELAQNILNACKKVATCLFHLYNSEENTYSHLNPLRSVRSIRFKATRQWVRVDSVQHVACFFARLFMAE